MFISSAMTVVVTFGSPKSLNKRRLVSTILSRVRLFGFFSMRPPS